MDVWTHVKCDRCGTEEKWFCVGNLCTPWPCVVRDCGGLLQLVKKEEVNKKVYTNNITVIKGGE